MGNCIFCGVGFRSYPKKIGPLIRLNRPCSDRGPAFRSAKMRVYNLLFPMPNPQAPFRPFKELLPPGPRSWSESGKKLFRLRILDGFYHRQKRAPPRWLFASQYPRRVVQIVRTAWGSFGVSNRPHVVSGDRIGRWLRLPSMMGSFVSNYPHELRPSRRSTWANRVCPT